MFVENLSSKAAKFYLRINKRPDKWQEVIQNDDEYTLDWNQFIVKLHFIKMEIIWLGLIYYNSVGCY